MHYFSYISNEYSTKNKLEAAILKELKNIERQVIPENDCKAFQKNIEDKISCLNKQFSRCTPFYPQWWSAAKQEDIKLTFGGMNNPICNFYLYASKKAI